VHLEQRVDESIVEIETSWIDLASITNDARPRDREAVCVKTQDGHVLDVLAIAVVMVAGHIAGRRVRDRPWSAAEHVPDRWSLAVAVVRPFDLICARRDAEQEPRWERACPDDRTVRARAHGHLADTDRGLHFSTPVMTTPRMNARWAKKKIATGTMMDMTAAAWISVGFCE